MSAGSPVQDRLRRVRARWHRAVGADGSQLAARRVEMAAVAASEEAHLMTELDRDLTVLEQRVLAVAERRVARRS